MKAAVETAGAEGVVGPYALELEVEAAEGKEGGMGRHRAVVRHRADEKAI